MFEEKIKIVFENDKFMQSCKTEKKVIQFQKYA